MVLIVYIEGVGEVLRLAGRGETPNCQTAATVTQLIHSDTGRGEVLLPVNVGPQGQSLGLDLLHRKEEINLTTFTEI